MIGLQSGSARTDKIIVCTYRGILFRGSLYTLVFLINVTLFAKVRSVRVRRIALLGSSLALYLSWSSWFATVLLLSTVVNFALGQWLRRDPGRLPMILGVLFNLMLLGTFKYLPGAANILSFSSLPSFARLGLPLGISFWTFQAMSYLFDSYRGENLDPSFSEFALYIAFFPVIISGPICRLPDMLPQFRSQSMTRMREIGRGFGRIAVGILMMQLARLLGQGVLSGDGIDRGFDRLTRWSATDVWCLAFGFALQLFFDFAGYSHIAIGAAQAMGFTVPENFSRPLASSNPSVFWTRWHMSLSFWIRDYVFFPLATMRREVWWRNFVLVLSMVLFGLWHGATVLFLLWGTYHGLLLLMHRQFQKIRRALNFHSSSVLWSALSWLTTAMLISAGWILFRSRTLPQAKQMLSTLLVPASYRSQLLSPSLYALVFVLAAGYACTLFVGDALDRATEGHSEIASSTSGFVAGLARSRWYWLPPLCALALLIVLIVTHGQEVGAAQFRYRRF